MTDQAPNNYSDLYRTFFQNAGQSCDPKHADKVLIQVSASGFSTTAEFKLPRDSNTFNVVKQMIIAAFRSGDEFARAEIRQALNIRECSHED